MSIGTIVVIVIAVTMLILGMVLVRTIMCAGMGMVDDIENKMRNEISTLFGEREFGVRCMGAAGHDRPSIGDGGNREIYCMIREDRPTNYKLEVVEVQSRERDYDISNWIIHSDGWEGVSGVGDNMVRIVEFNIPRGVPATTLSIKVNEYRDGSTQISQQHDLRIDVKNVGTVARAVC